MLKALKLASDSQTVVRVCLRVSACAPSSATPSTSAALREHPARAEAYRPDLTPLMDSSPGYRGPDWDYQYHRQPTCLTKKRRLRTDQNPDIQSAAGKLNLLMPAARILEREQGTWQACSLEKTWPWALEVTDEP
ncbi:hypothetical protein E5288_WYG006207 [Bos mutus]|uniref:Uncharacterized protein n=1 Tax=Bos mutus TaxID=72004 RepID=A0A6B0QUE5_9CETA|nr:hypothetical protein [Bos mutus]